MLYNTYFKDGSSEENLPDLNIDKEFKDLISPLSEEEYRQLEENIIANGCLNPIIVWNGFIIDGHNRYEICRKGIPIIHYDIKEMDFSNKHKVKIWIINNQLGRRNLNSFQRGELAFQICELIQEQAKENQKSAGGAVPQKSAEPIDTRKELAKIAGVSHDTIDKVKKISAQASPEDLDKLRSGETTINAISRKLKCQEEAANCESSSEKMIQATIKGIACRMQKLSDMKEEIPSECKESLRGWIDILLKIVDCDKNEVAA